MRRILGASLWFGAGPALADWQLNFQPPETEVTHRIYDLHIIVLLVCLGIFIVVFGAMFYALFKHRRRAGRDAHHFHENTTIEVIWTVIPFLILLGLAWPATKAVLDRMDSSHADLTIKVVAHQWKWEYDYIKEGVKFMSVLSTPRDEIGTKLPKDKHYLLHADRTMVVPVGKKVRLSVTRDDVVHSWWGRALGVKQDAIPGFTRTTWFRVDKPGIYRGRCGELCGKGQAFMPIVVKAVPEAEYQAWLAAEKQPLALSASESNKTFTLAELKARGEKVYQANCATCHQLNGKGIPGAFPALAGDKVVNGDKTEHIRTVLHGRPGTAMPAFGPQLPDVDIAAVLTYERNSWGNRAGMVQPSDVKALRK